MDEVYDIAEAKRHFSELIARVENGERLTIVRGNRPVALLSPAVIKPQDTLARIDAAREGIRKRRAGHTILKDGETWRDLVDEDRRA
jgi:prevent-host-death family protein